MDDNDTEAILDGLEQCVEKIELVELVLPSCKLNGHLLTIIDTADRIDREANCIVERANEWMRINSTVWFDVAINLSPIRKMTDRLLLKNSLLQNQIENIRLRSFEFNEKLLEFNERYTSVVEKDLANLLLKACDYFVIVTTETPLSLQGIRQFRKEKLSHFEDSLNRVGSDVKDVIKEGRSLKNMAPPKHTLIDRKLIELKIVDLNKRYGEILEMASKMFAAVDQAEKKAVEFQQLTDEIFQWIEGIKVELAKSEGELSKPMLLEKVQSRLTWQRTRLAKLKRIADGICSEASDCGNWRDLNIIKSQLKEVETSFQALVSEVEEGSVVTMRKSRSRTNSSRPPQSLYNDDASSYTFFDWLINEPRPPGSESPMNKVKRRRRCKSLAVCDFNEAAKLVKCDADIAAAFRHCCAMAVELKQSMEKQVFFGDAAINLFKKQYQEIDNSYNELVNLGEPAFSLGPFLDELLEDLKKLKIILNEHGKKRKQAESLKSKMESKVVELQTKFNEILRSSDSTSIVQKENRQNFMKELKETRHQLSCLVSLGSKSKTSNCRYLDLEEAALARKLYLETMRMLNKMSE